MLISQILIEALEKDASDIIISTGSHPSIKVYGEITYLENYPVIDKELFEKEIIVVMNQNQKDKFKKELELDFSIDFKGYSRFRVNAFSQKSGYGLVFRPIKSELPTFDKLGLPNQILEFANKKNGLVLITGGVGTGKSTTLASLINYINKTKKKHVITVEDPMEYVFKNEKSLVEQREIGVNTLSFDNGLKYALRQAPDVIMVGEMRDLETFRLALRAAETGNLVFATLHTSGAARTVARVIDMFPADERDQIRQQLSESLLGVVWQDLIKKADGTGRVPAVEILVNTISIANMIRKGNTHQINGAIETGSHDGMISMSKYLEFMLKKNFITEEIYNENIKTLNLIKLD
nr:type IV pilus twitching motility protein PilT [Candidatus Gracilibacteria bacterium]